jgi:hypothetical protein
VVHLGISENKTKVMVIMTKEMKSALEKKAGAAIRSLSNYIVSVLEKDLKDGE